MNTYFRTQRLTLDGWKPGNFFFTVSGRKGPWLVVFVIFLFVCFWLLIKLQNDIHKPSIGPLDYEQEYYENLKMFDSWTNKTKWKSTVAFLLQHFKVEKEFCQSILQIGDDPRQLSDQDAYRICLDKRLKFENGNCLVYSFGYG